MKKNVFSLFLTMLICMVGSDCFAYDFEQGGLYYNYVEGNPTGVTVTRSLDKTNFGTEPAYRDKSTITIPNTVKDWHNTYRTFDVIGIEEKAFNGCINLTNITLPNTLQTIGDYAFNGCKALTSIEIPNSVTSIGKWAFHACTGLTTVTLGNSVTSIDEFAFENCSSLTSIIIPASVTSIVGSAFEDCSSMSSMSVASGNNVYDSRGGCNAIIETNTKTLIATCKNTTIPDGVEKIAYRAFYDLPSRTSVTLPNSVKEIGRLAFYQCYNLRNIYMPGVESIGEQAFVGCGLTQLYLPSSLTSIDAFAFYNCSDLIRVIFDNCNNLTSIGEGAFQVCTSLPSIRIPNSVTSIGAGAFTGCDELTAVQVENATPITLTSQPFGNYQNATLYVPYGSRSNYIAANYWKDFKTITELASNNIAFADDLVKTICVGNWDTDNDGEISYDEAAAVTSIPENTFSNKAITSFNEFSYFTGITNIGGYTFQNCTALTSIVFPNSITTIGHSAFVGCSALETIDINEGVTTIGVSAFQNCNSLKSISIPSTVNKLGEYWVDNVFVGCYSLESITVDPFNTTYTSNNSNAIIYKNDNYLVTGCKNTIIPATVKSIGQQAFYNISSLKSIEIPSSVTYIGINSFGGTGLNSIVIPEGVITIGSSAFSYCSDLASIDLPASLTTIDDYAFANLPSLNKVTCHWQNPINYKRYSNSSPFSNISSNCCLYVPEGKTDDYIAKGWTTNVFKGGIVEVGKIIQTMEMTSIPTMTYGDAPYTLPQTTNEGLTLTWEVSNTNIATVSSNILTITGAGTTTVTATQAGNDDYKSFSRDYTLTVNPKNVSSLTISDIAAVTYNGSAQTPTVTVKDGTTTLTNGTDYTVSYSNNINVGTATVTITGKGNYTGTKTANFTINPKNASSLTISDIAAVTYNGSAQTPAVTVKDGTTTLTSGTDYTVAYSNNTNVGTATVTITGMGNYTGTKTASFTIILDETRITFADSNVKALCVANWDTSNDGEVNEEEAAAVTTLGSVFKNNVNITSFNELQYFTGLTAISDNAFYGCSGLTSVTIPNSVTSIGDYAFRECGLTSVTIPNSVTAIGVKAFRQCSALTSVTIGNSVTSIETEAFSYCSSLTSVTIGNSVTSIGMQAFYGCIGLTSVTIPNSVTSIGIGNFQNCSGLTSVTIPNSVTTIGNYAFQNCSGLTSITIPNSVTTIGNYAFDGCNSLTSVTVKRETPITISSNVFSNYADATLYVPSVAAYEAANVWKDFYEITHIPESITMNSLGKGTFCSEHPLDFTDVSGIKAYIISGFDPSAGNLIITRVYEVPARTGLFIDGTPGMTFDIPVKETDFYYSNMMKGITVATVIPSYEDGYTNYTLGSDGHGGVIFRRSGGTATSPANRAYVQIPSSMAGARSILGIEEDGTTGFEGIRTPDTEDSEGDYYNLNGQKVQSLKRGIYIKNGKKIIKH